MAVKIAEIGRNEPCTCGSGRKYKHCCASKATKMTRGQMVMLVLISVILAGGLALAVTSRQQHAGAAMGVWSEEHGHYH
jgi:hypothetical protein